jgi:predicted aldo/keto reductase-like oxidoreductase
MKYKNELSILGFGCMRLPDNFEKSEKLILKAFEEGVNYFDTAYIYPGKEALLGKILHKNNLRKKVKIATKLPIFMCKSYADFDKLFNKQLSRLKTDYVDYYLLHALGSPEALRGLIGIGIDRWIAEKKREGKIGKIGFSFHGKGSDFVGIVDSYEWDFCMIQYNYLDVNNQAGNSGLKHAHSKGLPVMIMEPLRGGLLANPAQIPPKAKKIFDSAEAVESLALSPAQWAFRWLWNHDEITCVLSGMRHMPELDDNISAAEISHSGCMSEEELGVIEKATDVYRESNSIPCTGCNYCMPCPVGVNIPGCFAAYNSYCLNRSAFSQYMLNTSAMTTKKALASSCIQCGKCEQHCPQSIAIRQSLKTVSRKLEPWWFKIGMSAVRLVMKPRHKKTDSNSA